MELTRTHFLRACGFWLAVCLGVATVSGQTAASAATAGSQRTTKGSQPGPAARIQVGRSERPAVIGLAEQLAGLQLLRGSLQVDENPAANPDNGKSAAAEAAIQIAIVWTGTTKQKGYQPPTVTSSDPQRALRWLQQALQLDGDAGGKLQVGKLPGAGNQLQVQLEFVPPKTGLSKARQFRHARRFCEAALAELGLLRPQLQPWPPGFPAAPALCLYDAEGVGGSGCENLERVVDETTLGYRILPVCPEDIRDGGLQGMAAVMFPGGSGGGIAKALEPAGVEAVRKFVGAGGGYFGVCAGAYFAAAGLKSYAALVPWIHNQPWAKGSAELKVELTPLGKQMLGEEFGEFITRYNNGPVFPTLVGNKIRTTPTAADAAGPMVLATFASPSRDKNGVTHEGMVGTPAIAADRFKNGRVLVISPHPEGRPQLDAMVARAIGWTLGLAPEKITAKQSQ